MIFWGIGRIRNIACVICFTVAMCVLLFFPGYALFSCIFLLFTLPVSLFTPFCSCLYSSFSPVMLCSRVFSFFSHYRYLFLPLLVPGYIQISYLRCFPVQIWTLLGVLSFATFFVFLAFLVCTLIPFFLSFLSATFSRRLPSYLFLICDIGFPGLFYSFSSAFFLSLFIRFYPSTFLTLFLSLLSPLSYIKRA
jgi:hypothetical protein